MNILVVDAGVAAKWFLPAAGEPLTDKAVKLLTRYGRGQLQFLVPDLFWSELGNIFWKAVRQGRWSQADGASALGAICGRKLPTVPTISLLEDAFAIANTFQRSVCDSFYVSLALVARADLVTADKKLAQALAAHLPVKWLGSVL